MANGKRRVTLLSLDSKLSDLITLVEKHAERDEVRFTRLDNLLQGEDEKPGLKGRLDRLEQTETRRGNHIKALWGAVIGGAVTWVLSKVS